MKFASQNWKLHLKIIENYENLLISKRHKLMNSKFNDNNELTHLLLLLINVMYKPEFQIFWVSLVSYSLFRIYTLRKMMLSNLTKSMILYRYETFCFNYNNLMFSILKYQKYSVSKYINFYLLNVVNFTKLIDFIHITSFITISNKMFLPVWFYSSKYIFTAFTDEQLIHPNVIGKE